MEAYQQRVEDELIELRGRRAKLFSFIHGIVGEDSIFHKLPEDEQSRLRKQLVVMDMYASVLEDRINHFSGQKVAQ